MYKRLLTLIIISVFSVGILFSGCGKLRGEPAGAENEPEPANFGLFDYTATHNDYGVPSIRLTGFTEFGRENQTEWLIIPDEIDGFAVKEIGYETSTDDAFRNSTARYIQIGGGVELIEHNAFVNAHAEIVYIKDGSVELEIRNSAFSYMPDLHTVVLGNTVKNLNNGAFYACPNLTTVVMGENITTILNGVFNNSPKIINMVIPASMTNLQNSFGGCKIKNLIFDGTPNDSQIFSLQFGWILGYDGMMNLFFNRLINATQLSSFLDMNKVLLFAGSEIRDTWQATYSGFMSASCNFDADTARYRGDETAQIVRAMFAQHEQILQKDGEIDDYAAEVARLGGVIDDLGGEIDRLGGVINGLNDDIRDLEDDLDELQGKHDGLVGDKADLIIERDAKEAARKILQDKIDNGELVDQAELDALNTAIDGLNGQIGAKQTAIDALDAEITAKETEISGLRDHIAGLTTERDDHIAEKNALKTELDELRLTHDAACNALRAQVADLTAENNKLKNAKPKSNPVMLIVGSIIAVIGLGCVGGGATMFVLARRAHPNTNKKNDTK